MNDRMQLVEIAERAMVEQGFVPHPPPAAEAEVARLTGALPASPVDLRALPWTSIDNPESRDLDQVEACERTTDGTRLYVGIADVASWVAAQSAVDQFARGNSTSVYTGVRTFPMLPDRLSFDLTSLIAAGPRLAVVFETTLRDDGSRVGGRLYPALVQNRAKLDYPTVSAWLEGQTPPPRGLEDPALQAQIHAQDELADRLAAARIANGALDLDTGETRAVVDAAGLVTGLIAHHQDRAGRLVSELMIASNQTVARVLDEGGVSSLRRVVKTPERWSRIVQYAAERGATLPEAADAAALGAFVARMRRERPHEIAEISLAIVKLIGRGEYAAHRPGTAEVGHFGLAVGQYTHGTAPNRRYVNLVTQRLILAHAHGAPSPYSDDELAAIAAHATQREGDAQKVERQVHKAAAASLIGGRIGESFDAIVTGASSKGTFVRVLSPLVEGKLVRGAHELAVGDRVRVTLRDVNIDRGFIDFVMS